MFPKQYFCSPLLLFFKQNEAGQYHSESGPALTVRNAGRKLSESFYQNGEFFSPDGIVHVAYHEDGTKMLEIFFRRDKVTGERVHGTNVYDENGNLAKVVRFKNGKFWFRRTLLRK